MKKCVDGMFFMWFFFNEDGVFDKEITHCVI